MLTSPLLLVLGATISLLIFLVGGLSKNAIFLTVLLRITILVGIRRTALLVVPTLSILLAVWYLFRPRPASVLVQDGSSNPVSGPLRPLIFPSKTTHTRLVPKINSFGYSYLLVGIPIGWQGRSEILGLDKKERKPWFSIRAADYLSRDSQSSLHNKLAVYLSSQGDSLEHYAHVYLITAPRFLGYAFNPVSFWYLYSKNLRLEAMILEVNNTFDERRMYFMKRGSDTSIDAVAEEPKFTHRWPKDFHVSPFNSRKGDYSLAAINPFASVKRDQPNIDNVITLRSSDGVTKLVARIYSTSSAVDPASMTTKDVAVLLLGWFWVGFMTFPRILFQAGRLYFQHKLHVWYRPEVHRTSIGRQPTAHERVIEPIFQAFFQYQVQHSTASVSWKYTPPTGSASDARYFASSTVTSHQAAGHQYTLRVLTPQFYTWITALKAPAHYISWVERRHRNAESLDTYQVSSQSALARLLRTYSVRDSYGLVWSKVSWDKVSWSTALRARILIKLREVFRGADYPHPLDRWVLEHDTLTTKEKNTYFRSATAIQLVEEALGGFYPVLDGLMLGLQVFFTWEAVGFLVSLGGWVVSAVMMRNVSI